MMKTVTKATVKKAVASGNLLPKRDRVPIRMPHSSGELIFAEMEAHSHNAKCSRNSITMKKHNSEGPLLHVGFIATPNCSCRGPTTVPGGNATTHVGRKSR